MPPPSHKLSPNFWLTEFTDSQVAARRGIANQPTPLQIASLRRMAALLEEVRALLGAPIVISSGFRSAALNAAVGGASNSAHLDGRAADFSCPGFGTPRAICQRLVAVPLEFDQLIFEGTWVHLGIHALGDEPRRQVLTAVFTAGQKTRYVKGVV